MKTKILILLSLIAILYSCNKEDYLTARLISVYDDHPPYLYNPEIDRFEGIETICVSDFQKMEKKIYRELSLRYRLINQCDDSVFIPFDYNYNPSISVRIQGQDSISFPVSLRGIGNRKHEHDYFAPNDTIFLHIVTRLSAVLSHENKWLYQDKVYSILSKLDVNVSFDSISLQHKDKIIPYIIFVNDSDGVLINPKPVIKKW